MSDMRDDLLNELIDKMHSRMADKMYPPEVKESEDDQPEVTEVSPTAAEAEKEIDVDKDAELEPSDAEIDELLS